MKRCRRIVIIIAGAVVALLSLITVEDILNNTARSADNKIQLSTTIVKFSGQARKKNVADGFACYSLGAFNENWENSSTCNIQKACIKRNNPGVIFVQGSVAALRNLSVMRKSLLPDDERSRVQFRSVKPGLAEHFVAGQWVWMERYAPENYGHVLGDEVFASWRMLSLFGLNHLSDVTNILTDIRSSSLNQYETMTNSERVFTFSDIFAQHGSLVCFQSILIGAGGLGYAQGNWNGNGEFRDTFRRDFAEFRRQALLNLRVDPPLLPQIANIVLLVKNESKKYDHMQTIQNSEEIFDVLKKELPKATVKRISFDDMPMKGQVHAMNSANVVISQPGSPVMNAAWMRTQRSSLILVGRLEQNGLCDVSKLNCGNEYGIWFKHSGHRLVCITKGISQKDLNCTDSVSVSLRLDPRMILGVVKSELHAHLDQGTVLPFL